MSGRDTSENVPSAHAPILQPGSLMCVCGEHADAAAHAPTGGDEVLVSRNTPPPPPAATGWWTRPRFSVEQAVFAWVGITVGRILYAILQKEW